MDTNLISKEIVSPELELFLQEPIEVQSIINDYMTNKCTLNIKEQTNEHMAICDNYHNEIQKRRNPFRNGRLLYRSEICMFYSNYCKKYDDCDKCHNNYEYCFHPEKFRTSSCNMMNCRKFGKICPFSHSVNTLRKSYSYTNNNLNIINNKYNYIFNNSPTPQIKIDIPPIKLLNAPISYDSMRRVNENIFINGLKETDLTYFKVFPCNIYTKHNEKQCVFYHSAKDFKRLLSKINYSFELCKFAEAGRNCPNSEFCLRSHNRVEQFYHPEKFKSKFCSHINNLNNCPYGNFCSFAHNEGDIKVELIHKYEQNEDFFIYFFKSVWCPYNHAHDKSSCVYAHNWQDYRRSPVSYQYSENACSFWDNKKTILNYNEGCLSEYRCNNCHGWKEQDYHPLIYKTKKCKYLLAFCNKGVFCPFYHKEEKQRVIDDEEREIIKQKIEHKMPLNVYISPVHQIHTEFTNKSEMIAFSRNSVMSLDYKPFVNNSFNQNLEKNSFVEKNIPRSSIISTGFEQNMLINNATNNTNANGNNSTMPSTINNISYSTLLNERSNSIFSNNSIKSIKIPTPAQNFPRVSIIAKNTRKQSNFNKENPKSFQRFSQILQEHILEKLEDIEDKGSCEVSANNSFDENLDFSEEFSNMMKKENTKSKEYKNSFFTKLNHNDCSPKKSMIKQDSLSITDFQGIKDKLNNKQIINDRDSIIIVNKKHNDSSFEDHKYRKQLLDYLSNNKFFILYRKVLHYEMSTRELCFFEDENMNEMVEEENKEKIPILKKFINELDDAADYENLLKKIDIDILNGNILLILAEEAN